MKKSWLDRLLESTDEVDGVIGSAIDSDDAQGIEDINKASSDVLDNGVSNDPDALTYDDNCYSQTLDMGDETLAGYVGATLGDTKTNVNSGNEIAATTEGVLSADEYNAIYTEAVAEVINESKAKINAKYKKKVAKAKAKKKASRGAKGIVPKKGKKSAVAEAVDVQKFISDIFD